MAMEFDITTKHLFLRFPEDFIQLTTGVATDVEIMDTTLKQVEVRYTDVLAWARIPGEDDELVRILVHIEFQTEPDVDMPYRMAGYIGRLIEAYKTPVHPTVIYLRPQEGIIDPGIYQHTFPMRFIVEYNVIRIWEIDGESILRKCILGLLPFTPLMQAPKNINRVEWLQQCVKIVEATEIEVNAKRDLLACLGILSGLVYDAMTIKYIISEEIMRESSIIQEIIAQTRAQSILTFLESRFGDAIDEEIRNQISAIQDEERLIELNRKSAILSLDEFKRELDSHPSK